MKNEYQNAVSIGIIGGADGPTSVFINGKKTKMSFKNRLNKYRYKYKRKKAEKKIAAGVHTLKEVAAYAIDVYGAIEVNKQMDEFPDASHMYEIKADDYRLEIEMDDTKDTFSVSFSGNKKKRKHFRKIAKDLYLYYGVSENDISQKTERYLSLLGVLSL